jgi:hypothetical protein
MRRSKVARLVMPRRRLLGWRGLVLLRMLLLLLLLLLQLHHCGRGVVVCHCCRAIPSLLKIARARSKGSRSPEPSRVLDVAIVSLRRANAQEKYISPNEIEDKPTKPMDAAPVDESRLGDVQ